MNHINPVQYNNFVGIDFSHLTKAGGYLVLSLVVILLTACQGGSTVNNTSQPYTIEKVALANKLDENGEAVGNQNRFTRDQQIICWVRTQGGEGNIHFRWFHETTPSTTPIYEGTAKTTQNHIFSAINSTAKVTLPLGKYRVEVYNDSKPEPQEVLYFTVEPYIFDVIPPQPIPANHQEIELAPLIEVPFAFDETWNIDGKAWEINEVKVVFLAGQEPFLSVVVKTTDIENPAALSAEQAKTISKPIAVYAFQHHYLDIARSLQIDNKKYALDKSLYVTLAKRYNNGGVTDESSRYRTEFKLNELQP